jgi:hypothetical protein
MYTLWEWIYEKSEADFRILAELLGIANYPGGFYISKA